MPKTRRQQTGAVGERAVIQYVACPRCNRPRTFRALPPGFEVVDVICKFCGFLAQVKAERVSRLSDGPPASVKGASWPAQQQRIVAGIFHGLYVVAVAEDHDVALSIDYIPAHVLAGTLDVFDPARRLEPPARRAGWQGFFYRLGRLPSAGIVRVYERTARRRSR